MATYPMHVAGLDRDFPICKVTDDLYIGAFIMFGDAELTVRCAEELLKLAEGIDYDYLFTAEAKSIPLIHEMARQSGAKKYFIARKGPKVYMPDPISVEDKSITTVAQQKLSSALTTRISSAARRFCSSTMSSPQAARSRRWKHSSKRRAAPLRAAWPFSPRAAQPTARTSCSLKSCPSSTPTAA